MANDADFPDTTPPDQASPSGPPAGAPTPPPPPPQGGNQGGGPVLAALTRRAQQPPTSAPGQGNVAQGLMMLKSAVDMIQQALPNLAAGSQQHRDALQAAQRLSRHLPQGTPTAGVQQTQLSDMLRNTVRNALMQRLMQGQSQNPAGPQGPQGPPSGMAGIPQPPSPSTPLPGA